MDKKTHRRGVDEAYRRSALRVVSALSTVSADAGIMTLRMLREERRNHLTNRRTGPVHPDQMNDYLTNRWQHEWTSSIKGRWTNTLNPNTEVRIGRKHDKVHFYLTQLLTGHGCYRARCG